MAYHDDLLAQALMLVQKEPRKPKQASLRRAVSTSYYAIFHLLISESVANWKRPEHRAALSRAFDHGIMKSASNRVLDLNKFPYAGEDPRVVAQLKYVAKTFAQLQEQRHTADYDSAKSWTKTEALLRVESVRKAFSSWKNIRGEHIAQAYLMSLLVKRRD